MPSSDSTDHFDPWQSLPDLPKMGGKPLPAHALDFVTIEDVVPLDAQIGVSPKKTVPDTLQDVLFRQPEPIEVEIAAAGGDPTTVPQMQTYAVLDAGKIMHLPEKLDSSGLEHRCLYQGDAGAEHGHVAPWLVRLEEGNGFSRSLFLAAEEPDNLWRSDPDTLIRSRAPLEEIRGHLRKFTRIQDENGKWFYLRFWEGWHFHVLAGRQEKLPEMSRLFARILGDTQAVALHYRLETAVQTRVVRKPQAERFVLTDALRAEFKLAVFYRNMMASAFDLHAQHPEEAKRYGIRPQDMWPLLFDFADEVRAAGLCDPRLRARMMLLAFISLPEPWPAFVEAPIWREIRASGRADELFEDFCNRLKYQNARNGTTDSIWW